MHHILLKLNYDTYKFIVEYKLPHGGYCDNY
jgi:hypothetical protein